jgi:polysaccharide pyruvyl transferase WcaK-like protein
VRVLLIGYGGANNTGAEVHTDEAIKQMRNELGGRLDITVISLSRKRSLRYTDEDECLRIVEIPPIFIFSILKLVLRSDMVVLIEGYCFMEYFSQVLFWLFMYAAGLAQRLGLPTVGYAVDAGKLRPANAEWAREVADRMDLLMVRTKQAADALKEIGVSKETVITADTAFTIEPESDEWRRKVYQEEEVDISKPVIGIAFEEFFWWPVVPSLSKFLTGRTRDRFKSIYYHTWTPERRKLSREMKGAVAQYADWVAGELDANIEFFAMERVNAEPCRDVMNMMIRPAVLFDADRYNGSELTALLRGLKFLVTSEYHAMLLSMGAEVPFIGLGHDERIESVMGELGLKEDYFIHYREDEILKKLKAMSVKLLENEDSVRSSIIDALPSYHKRLLENGEHFAELVNKRFPLE